MVIIDALAFFALVHFSLQFFIIITVIIILIIVYDFLRIFIIYFSLKLSKEFFFLVDFKFDFIFTLLCIYLGLLSHHTVYVCVQVVIHILPKGNSQFSFCFVG